MNKMTTITLYALLSIGICAPSSIWCMNDEIMQLVGDFERLSPIPHVSDDLPSIFNMPPISECDSLEAPSFLGGCNTPYNAVYHETAADLREKIEQIKRSGYSLTVKDQRNLSVVSPYVAAVFKKLFPYETRVRSSRTSEQNYMFGFPSFPEHQAIPFSSKTFIGKKRHATKKTFNLPQHTATPAMEQRLNEKEMDEDTKKVFAELILECDQFLATQKALAEQTNQPTTVHACPCQFTIPEDPATPVMEQEFSQLTMEQATPSTFTVYEGPEEEMYQPARTPVQYPARDQKENLHHREKDSDPQQKASGLVVVKEARAKHSWL